MKDYLTCKFEDTPGMVSTFDELPLWSASFGLLLLQHLDYKRGRVILDIGSGAGFPLLELAARFGNTCKCYGLDTWANANIRARQKAKDYGLTNVEIIDGTAERIPFDNNSVDLIVSNLGINNFENPAAIFAECARVLRPGGKLALTTNVDGHWAEFYNVFEDTLRQMGKEQLIPNLCAHEQHRGNVYSISELFHDSGLNVTRHIADSFDMKFVDGSALLNHHFVKLGWMGAWRELIEDEDQQAVFSLLEDNLNVRSEREGGLKLTVPMLFIEGEKSQ